MRRSAQLWLSIAMLAPAAHAGEMELRITLPEPQWLLPSIALLPQTQATQPGRDFPVLGENLSANPSFNEIVGVLGAGAGSPAPLSARAGR